MTAGDDPDRLIKEERGSRERSQVKSRDRKFMNKKKRATHHHEKEILAMA